jgi:hypothetical protein
MTNQNIPTGIHSVDKINDAIRLLDGLAAVKARYKELGRMCIDEMEEWGQRDTDTITALSKAYTAHLQIESVLDYIGFKSLQKYGNI